MAVQGKSEARGSNVLQVWKIKVFELEHLNSDPMARRFGDIHSFKSIIQKSLVPEL